jgi:hypothetical protein
LKLSKRLFDPSGQASSNIFLTLIALWRKLVFLTRLGIIVFKLDLDFLFVGDGSSTEAALIISLAKYFYISIWVNVLSILWGAIISIFKCFINIE